ncbi:MAG TPA: hypothetical protein VKX28_09720 [Xanthobacteraceae bacterium]|nr:hypothetical protein [Xanthobacteraceae bacterium]
MKHALIGLLVLLAIPARAASLEDAYLAARDGYIKRFEKNRNADADAGYAALTRALADLQAKLLKIIGSTHLDGFSPDGKITLDALDSGDEDFGLLDGLVYTSKDQKTRVLVTTASLFDKWLKAHERFWEETPLPTDMAAALKRDDFYTQAVTNGSAVVTYAEIPVAKPASATLAFAVLDGRTQDQPPAVPDEMIITVRRADRVFVITAATAVKAGPIAACDAIHARLAAEAQAAYDAAQAAGGKDAALNAKAEELAHKPDRAYPDCFATEAPKAAFFPALAKQAQQLIQKLPTK